MVLARYWSQTCPKWSQIDQQWTFCSHTSLLKFKQAAKLVPKVRNQRLNDLEKNHYCVPRKTTPTSYLLGMQCFCLRSVHREPYLSKFDMDAPLFSHRRKQIQSKIFALEKVLERDQASLEPLSQSPLLQSRIEGFAKSIVQAVRDLKCSKNHWQCTQRAIPSTSGCVGLEVGFSTIQDTGSRDVFNNPSSETRIFVVYTRFQKHTDDTQTLTVKAVSQSCLPCRDMNAAADTTLSVKTCFAHLNPKFAVSDNIGPVPQKPFGPFLQSQVVVIHSAYFLSNTIQDIMDIVTEWCPDLNL